MSKAINRHCTSPHLNLAASRHSQTFVKQLGVHKLVANFAVAHRMSWQSWEDGSMTQPSDAVQSAAQDQPIEDRVENRSHRPSSDAFKAFMASQWQQTEDIDFQPDTAASYAAQRRVTLSSGFRRIAWSFLPHPRFVPMTPLPLRPFPFAHLTGLGVDHEPKLWCSLLLKGTSDHGSNHLATLFFGRWRGKF